MHTSLRRWQVIQASGWEWHHTVRSRRAWARLSPPDLSRSVGFGGSSVGQYEAEEAREPWRLWVEQPDKVRTEFMVEDDTITAVIVGDTWWSWSPSRGVITNQGDPHHAHGRGPGYALIDPSSILPAIELGLARRTTFIGRPVLEVLATPAPIDDDDEESSDWRHATLGLGGGADEYALLVDAERGVLLRSEARIGGQLFRIVEMDTVRFDQDLEGNVFAPPTDRDVEPAWAPRAVKLIELPDAVPFTVFVPGHPPFGIEHADVHPPDRRYGIAEQINIAFASNSFGEEDRSFWVVESAEPLPERRAVEWNKANGMSLGEDQDVDPTLRVVRLERLGTYVELRSYHLEIEELLDLARSLVPLLDAPPSLGDSPH